jgi:hypothetical protein
MSEDRGAEPSREAWDKWEELHRADLDAGVLTSCDQFAAGWEAALTWAEGDGAQGTFCYICWLTDPAGADPARMVINGLSVCYVHAHYLQVPAELAAVLRTIRERKAAS